MGFTMEETGFMAVFDISGRSRLLSGIRESLPDLREPEMKELANSVLHRLEAMTDQELAALDLAPGYDF
ncbi:MAG: transposon-transfer assisting family protein [Bacillota bacterium]|uniref:Tranposon-transfer assisting protein n=1 Tax=Oxobacter pfennigii TaxID=36849 RepID=A0A0P8YCY9_9CLOT|nr:transposon-transfer assisting family protein [Oxobacter pfennigii]KPU45062.1 hypothetical protein OXPF_15400 [Oxobacter pfennigii]